MGHYIFGRFGTRFPALSDAYDRSLAKLTVDIAHELGFKEFVQEGVYCAQVGPAFETPAECRFLLQVRLSESYVYSEHDTRYILHYFLHWTDARSNTT